MIITSKLSTPFDHIKWVAVDNNYEPGDPQGFGQTEQEAIEDLNDQMEQA